MPKFQLLPSTSKFLDLRRSADLYSSPHWLLLLVPGGRARCVSGSDFKALHLSTETGPELGLTNPKPN